MRSKVVTLSYEEENGSISHVLYRRLAARLPGFLEKYPPDQYRLEFVTTDLLSTQTGYLELMKAAFAAGVRPTDLGVTSLQTAVNTCVCRATLYGPNNTIVRTASARGIVVDYKDHEKLETAAHQRILASLGFGGEVFSEDENRDFADQGLTLLEGAQGEKTSDTGTGTGSPAPIPLDLPDGIDKEEAEAGLTPTAAEPVSPPANRSSATASEQHKASDASATRPPRRPKPKAEPAEPKERPVTEALRRQIASTAKRLGEKASQVETEAQAIAELQRLGEIEHQRRRRSAG